MSSVQEALKAREERKKKEQENIKAKTDKINSAVNSYKERKKESAKTSASDLAKRINAEIEAIKKVSTPAYGSDSLKNTLNLTRENRVNVSNLIKEVESYKNYIDADTYNNFYSTLNTMRETYDSYLSVADMRSNFESEDDYNKWYNAYTEKLEMVNSDQGKNGWEKYLTDKESSKKAAEEKKSEESWMDKIGRWMGSGGPVDTSLPMGTTTAVTNAYRDGAYVDLDREPNDRWSEEQKLIFGYKYMENPSEAYAYAREINEHLDMVAEDEALKKIAESAASGFWSGVGNTIGAIATAPLGMADFLSDLVEANATGTISSHDGIVSPFEYSQAVTSGISSHLNEKSGVLDESIPIIGGKGLGDVYGLGTSIAQSMASAYTLGPYGTLISYFGQGAASGVDEALSRGATDEQAVLYGISLGTFEGLAEMVGIDNLFKLGSASTVKGFIKNILKQAGAEGMEEGLTSLLSNIADNVIMLNKSNFYALVEQYMAQGMSESEAKKKAWWDSVEGIAYDTIAGAISGGVSGGIHTTAQTIASNIDAKKNYGSGAELVTEALDIDSNNAYAQKMQTKLEGGKTLSGGQINRLIETNEQNLMSQDTSKIKSAVKERLTQLGELGDVGKLADVLTKQASGETLTRSEQNIIKNSKYGQRVANELNPENITSGQYTSAWAENLDTNRINPVEYSRALAEAENVAEGANVEKTPSPASQDFAQTAENSTASQHPTANEKATESEIEPLETVNNDESITENIPEVATTEESTLTLDDASKKYGAQAQAMVHTYAEGQDVAKYDAAYSAAYDMGRSGVALSYVMNSDSTEYLTNNQKELAYEAGVAASDTAAKERDAKNKSLANGKTGRRKGTVKGEGVKIEDLRKTFNDTQNKAYRILSTFAEATGVDIVLYKSEANADGDFEGAQGRFQWSDDKLYIDINAGLKNVKSVDDLAKYAMLRTFSHEFTHFIEKWNPIWYNEFRKALFAELTARGENVHDLIETKMSQNNGMTYEKASREVVAEAMTDILPDSHFVETLANNHKNIFEKLLEKLKEFLADLKAYFNTIGHNPSREANALKEQVGEAVHYVESIVELFDKVAIGAVENYQKTVAIDEVVEKPAKIDSTDTIKADKDSQKVSETAKTDKYDHFTITDNVEFGSLEITFDGKPSEAVRDVLKAHKFRWHGKKSVWYGKGERADIVNALQEAYKTETQEAKEEAKAAEGVGEYVDDYDRLKNAISNVTRYEIGGFLFRIYKNGNTWQGYLDQVIQSEGGYPVSDASGLHYKSEIFTNRQDAVEDIVAVARNNKLLGGKTEETAESVKPEQEKTATEILRDMGGKAVSDNMTDVTDVFFPELANKEEKPNVENVDNGSTVQQSDTDRQGDPQVLEGLQTEDVQGDVREGDSVGDSVERGQETRRDDVRDGSGAGTRSRSSVGDSQSRDIRRDDVLTPEAAEKLHEEITEQIAQQSTELPKGKNFVIGDSLDLPNGEKARYKANIEAIRLVKQLETEGRYATEAEQVILSKYVGWGGLANAFDERKADWSKEYKELKELLTKEEYELARGSTLNAHYTEISVIKAMYDGLRQLGFNGGRMMEPSSGVGNFVGAMPADMSAKVKSWTMVELDSITGLIAKYLYPNADVRIQGFEKANIPNNYMDVIISNVPFGKYPITDKAYPKKVTSAIHNYFFAKSLDKVRPGGIVMFITSSYTMNSKEETVRRYIMQRADLLGAIRLPDTAFKGNAGTEVVTDILILKKRAANTAYAGEDFLEAPYKYINGYNGAYINSYFDTHPEMVLGTASMEGSMYRGASLTYKALEGKGSLADQIREAFKSIKGKMDYPAQLSPEKTNFAVERAQKKKDGIYFVKDGKAYYYSGGKSTEVEASENVKKRMVGMLEIQDAARDLMNYQQQGLKESEIKKAREKLNKLYDAFVKKYGFINVQANRNAIANVSDKYSLFALENWNPDKKTATKSDIFSKNTIAPNRTVTSAKDVAEGLIVSVNQTGGVDVPLIAALTSKSVPDVTRELLDSRQAFKNRNGELETAETYLSGNVRAKLRDAEALVPMDSDYQKNVEALKAVIPEDVGYQDIFVNPGTPWIPSSVYSDFAAYMLGSTNSEWRQSVDVTRNPETGNFTVELKNSYLKFSAQNTQRWGTSRRSFLDLFDAMLNSKSVVIKDKLDDGSFVINKDATAAANEKIENITKEFQEWLWKDEARRVELATLYNETFNSIVTPKYNGDNLTVNGANAMKPLRPHQRNAVQRVISSGGNTLLAHKVGAGKTYEMAAAAMKLKELGLVKKPLFAVPKSLVAQWGTEFIDFFPTAKLLVAEASDFSTANRKVFMNRIANGDYDAVIVSYEQFEKLPVSDDFTRELYQEQINGVIAAIEEAKAEKGAKAMSVKDLEKKRKSLQAKIDKLTDKAKDEGNIDFEELGVDSLFIDEAHNFKNLFYTTSMTNVSGLGNKDGSKRAFDLYTKVRYLQKLNGGKGIVFATATPVMNSMSEMYIMQKYLQPDLLEQLGLSTFDAWAKQFGEVVNGVEIKPSGQGYRVKQSFSRFKNMSELQLLFRNFADVLTDIPGLKIPKMKGGKVNVVVCEPGQFQKDFMKELEKRADNIKNVDPSVDNMLKITSDGRKISYTQRMIEPTLPYEEGCKIYRCADNVVKGYNESKDIKGTQLIFCDMATPKGKSKTETIETDDASMDMESAKLYDDIKARLIQGGIPAKEIAFIHEADTDQKKKKLFADVNDGKVRVLIGSTGKMGVGMNAQKRVVAIHHLDAPWRPGDVEQRNGRAFRQGNINDEVECFTYVTEGSFDARLWDILERKQNFINQVMNGESVGRETEDTGEVTLSAAEVKALASGSPLILEQVQLDTDIKKLESLYRAHRSSVRAAKDRLEKDKGDIEVLKTRIENGKADVLSIKDTYSEGKFSITVGKQNFTEKKDAGVALMAEATAKAVDTGYTTIGSFAGFNVRVVKTHEGIKGLIVGKQGYTFNTYPNNTTFMINHIISVVEGISERVKMLETELAQTEKDMAEQEKLITEPFAKQVELDEKRKRYNEVMEILNPKEEQSLDSVADDTVQEQSRDYLEGDDYAKVQDEKENTNEGRRTPSEVKGDSGRSQTQNGNRRGVSTGNGGFPEGFRTRKGVAWRKRGIRQVQKEFSDDDFIVPMKNSAEENELKYLEQYNAEAHIVKASSWNKKHIAFVKNSIVYIKEEIPKKHQGKIAPHEATHLMMTEKYQPYLDFIGELPEKIDMSSYETHRLLEYTAGHCEMDLLNIKNMDEARRIFDEINAILYGYIGSDKIGQIPWNLRQIFYEPFQYIAELTAIHEQFKEDVKAEKEQDEVQYQQRTETLTDREVLEMASEEIKVSDLTQAERDALTIFQDRLSNLKDLQEKRAEQGRLYKEQQFGAKVDRQAASETLNRMQVLDGQIKKATADVLTVEEKEVLKRVLQKARKVVEVQERQHGQEILNRWRDRRKNAESIKKYRERLRGDVDELTNWIISPNNKDIVKHVPDVLKNSVIPFLSSINFMSKRSLKGGNATKADEAFMDRLKKLNAALKINIDASGLYSGYNDLPPNFMERLQTFIDSTDALVKKNSGELIINQMTSEELKDLCTIVRTLKKYIMQVNRYHNNAMYQHVYEGGDNSVEFMKELDNAGSHTGGMSNFLFWQQIRPAYAFERFGKGGEAIYDGLRRGQAKLAFNTKEIESFTKKAYTNKEVKAWEDEIKTFQFGADTVKIPVSYIMGLYELYKDPDGKRHIDNGGIRVATYTHDGKKISDVGHVLTIGNTHQLLSSLTDRQKEVADSLQKYMATQGAKWGNYVSVARFGEELFTNPNYYPINSDGRHLSENVEEHPSAASLYALLNMSFTKSRNEEATNRVVIYSIFDVFANHMASMAQYNAMALPILDALKWFNYQQVYIDDEGKKTVITSVREQMDRVYGVPEETRPGSGKQGYAETFIVNIIKSFNGTAAQGTPNDGFWLKQLHRYNVAQVAYNFRVVVQQPLAITRAGLLVDYKSIIKGMKLKPSAIKKNIEEMQKYSGIAAWKSLGFYDVNISRGLTHLIKHDSTIMDKVGDIGMWGAEKADTLTWAAIWSACKEEVIKKQHLTPESEGFYEAVTKLFEDVIYKTQVVDSILTKNEYMRDKGFGARMVSSFMSEPVTNASMLIDAVDKYNLDIKRGLTRQQAWEKNKLMVGRTIYVYALGAVMLAAVQSVADAWRDDDDYEEWYEKWLEAFTGNLFDEFNLFNKLPIISDAYEVVEAIISPLLKYIGIDIYSTTQQTAWGQIAEYGTQSAEIIVDKIMNEDTNYTWYGGIYKLLQAVSGAFGLPMASATREIITAWNNTVGTFAPSLKIKTYEPSELAQVRYAYEDGYLTDEEATEILLEKGLVDTENEAYFTIQGWEAGEGYSRYDAIYDAVLNGGDISAAMDELISHGYTEKDVIKQVKSQIGKWYYDEESQVRITKQQAINMLDKYTDMTDDEITAIVNEWSSVVVTGIKYDDIDDEFMEGNITASRAIEMYVRYGSMTKEKATEKVAVLEFVKKYPECEGISYAAVDGYNTYCEPLGVPANTYYDAWKYKNTLSGTVKEPMMAYINSLNLSTSQKDSLYFAFGWKESKLHEAPWH